MITSRDDGSLSSSAIISSLISQSNKDRAQLQELKANHWAVFLRASSFSSQQPVCFLRLKKTNKPNPPKCSQKGGSLKILSAVYNGEKSEEQLTV